MSKQHTDEALSFLRDLFGGATDGLVELRAIPRDGGPRHQQWFKDPGKLAEWITERDKRSTGPAIYFGVGKRHTRGGGKDDVWGVPALWADIDTGKLGLDAGKVAAALYRLPAALRPSAVVHSGGGLHAYYYLRRPVQLNTESRAEDTAQFERTNKLLQRALASDYVHDVSRVMRLPGTYNNKNNAKPVRARVIWSAWWDRRELKDLAEAFVKIEGTLIEGVPTVAAAPATDPYDYVTLREPGGKKPLVKKRLDDLWDRTRYHGDGGDMRAGYVGINQAITYTTCLLFCSPTGGYSNDETIIDMTLDRVRQRKEADAPGERWDWDAERETIRGCLARWKPKWEAIKAAEKAAKKKAK